MRYYDNVRFIYEFRDYQKRVLDSLDEKMNDNRIHIVAAPGSGKTVLGLELVRRLDKTALILVPSVSIREQWISRFLQLFVEEKYRAEWEGKISIELSAPATITCVTYQALFAMYNDENRHSCIDRLKDTGVVVLDESHHLKREWWKAMETTIASMDNPAIISLTATPPYDADKSEWSRYSTLCGEIDCEVLTPEMVAKKTLCPYQDYVYLTVPTEEELRHLHDRTEEAHNNTEAVLKGEILYRLFREYDALKSPVERAEIFVEEPYYLNALISYVRSYAIESAYFYELNQEAADKIISSWDEQIVKAAKDIEKPGMSIDQIKCLLECAINKDSAHFDTELVEQLRLELKKKKLYARNRLCTNDYQEENDRMLRNSQSKMSAIGEIVRLEAKSLSDRLKMVILTDHTGREELSSIGTQENMDDMSCVAIFEMLRRMEHLNNVSAYMKDYDSYMEELAGARLGMICGSFAIMPENALKLVGRQGKELRNTSYYLIEIGDSDRREIVAKVTEAMEQGLVNILVGTAALLGEGWDAPGVNTVVIGSGISSYVMTNQMRGRGLRLDPQWSGKSANIWHIAVVSLEATEDYDNLVRRFDTMLGVDYAGTGICSGIERVGLPRDISGYTQESVREYMNQVFRYASDRNRVVAQWDRLQEYGSSLDRIRDISVLKKKSRFIWKDHNGRIDGRDIRSLAVGLHKNMIRNKMIADSSIIRVEATAGKGRIGVYLENAAPKDNRLFGKYFEQLTGEIFAPRYVLIKGIGPWKNYFAVPDYCRSRDMADALARDIGFIRSEVIYTRGQDGIQFLFGLRIRRLKLDCETVSRVREIVIERSK